MRKSIWEDEVRKYLVDDSITTWLIYDDDKLIGLISIKDNNAYRRMVLFHKSYSAQAVASGRWAKIMSCSRYGYLYSRAAVVKNAVHRS